MMVVMVVAAIAIEAVAECCTNDKHHDVINGDIMFRYTVIRTNTESIMESRN